MQLEPGLHGVIVRIGSLTSGRVSINRVNISVESILGTAVRARWCRPAGPRCGACPDGSWWTREGAAPMW